MQVLVEASAARSGGGLARVEELAASLVTLLPSTRHVVVLNRFGAGRVELPPEGVEPSVLPWVLSIPPVRVAWQMLGLPSLVRRRRPDWLLAPFGVLPPRLGDGVRTAVILSNIAPFIRSIGASAGPYGRLRLWLLRRMTIRSVRAADVVFTLSEAAEALLGRSLEGRRVVRLPMAPPSPDLLEAARRERPTPAGQDPYFVVLADLLPHKGIEDAVAAIGAVARDHPGVELLVCGRPLDRRYAARLRDRSNGPVRFLGGVPHRQALALIAHARATLVTSRIENPGRVPFEAMALGSPIVAVDVPSSREACGEAALYYEPGDAAGLGRRMSLLLKDDAERQRLIEAGSQLVRDRPAASATSVIVDTFLERARGGQ